MIRAFFWLFLLYQERVALIRTSKAHINPLSRLSTMAIDDLALCISGMQPIHVIWIQTAQSVLEVSPVGLSAPNDMSLR